MYLRLRIPLPLIVREEKINDLITTLGLVTLGRELIVEIYDDSRSEFNAHDIICSIIDDLKGYSIKSNYIDEELWENRRIMEMASYVIRDIIMNGTLNFTRIMSSIDAEKRDGILFCLLSNGGIVFSITRDPYNPVCFRIPPSNYYIVELSDYFENINALVDKRDVFSIIEALWNSREKSISLGKSTKLKLVLIWKRNRKYYAIVRGKTSARRTQIYEISSWGMDIDIKI